jgi:hypothetical protein
VVTFNGQWHLLCSGHVTDGSCDPTSQWVAIDYYTASGLPRNSPIRLDGSSR